MTADTFEAELSVGPKAIENYSRMSYTMWFALAEFVDNSTQSRLNYPDLIDEMLRAEGQPLTVSIVHDRPNKTLTIADNSIGMNREDLVAALRIAHPTPDSKGRSKYGMGMKTAACWIGPTWRVVTCELGSGEEWTAMVDVAAIANHGAKVPLTMRPVSRDDHYTRITIDLRRIIQNRSEETIRSFLGSMYMFDLRPDADGQVALKLTYNGEEVAPPEESDWDTDPDGNVMKRDLPELLIGGKRVTGWIGVLRKGGRKFGGFSLFQNRRQIQGFPKAWKPSAIFGGVDDEGANNLIAQRLTGVLQLDGFVVSHTKDAVLFEGDEEEKLEAFLVKETKEFAGYAQRRRGAGQGRQKWSKDQLRDLAKDMRSEFTSPEMKDALNNADLPPIEVIASNNTKLLDTLTDEDEILRLDILPDLRVIMSMKETSPYEPYVVYVPGAQAGVVHVIINGLHPYYQTLETKDAIAECVQQYLFDAVAEFKTSKMVARVNPDSVRTLKNMLLRARAEQLDNADAEVRAQAEADLFRRKAGPAA